MMIIIIIIIITIVKVGGRFLPNERCRGCPASFASPPPAQRLPSSACREPADDAPCLEYLLPKIACAFRFIFYCT